MQTQKNLLANRKLELMCCYLVLVTHSSTNTIASMDQTIAKATRAIASTITKLR